MLSPFEETPSVTAKDSGPMSRLNYVRSERQPDDVRTVCGGELCGKDGALFELKVKILSMLPLSSCCT